MVSERFKSDPITLSGSRRVPEDDTIGPARTPIRSTSYREADSLDRLASWNASIGPIKSSAWAPFGATMPMRRMRVDLFEIVCNLSRHSRRIAKRDQHALIAAYFHRCQPSETNASNLRRTAKITAGSAIPKQTLTAPISAVRMSDFGNDRRKEWTCSQCPPTRCEIGVDTRRDLRRDRE